MARLHDFGRSIFGRSKITSNLPTSPLALRIIGHLHLLGPIPHQALHKLSMRYGPLIHFFLGSVPCIVACSPETAKEILKIHETSFCDRPISATVDYLTYGSADFAFAPYGPYWKFEEIKRFMQLMLKKAKASEAVDVGRELIRLTNNVMSRMTMGQICSNNEEEADEGFGKKMKEARKRFDTMMERIIKEQEETRKTNKETGRDDALNDLLDILLTVSEDESSEIKLTMENIKAFIMNIFSGGTDTSAITIESLAELINHPDIMNKAKEEIDETLRLHHAGPMSVRESTENCTINGYEIPAKTRVFINVWSIGRDPKHWEAPLEFRPERFIAEDGKSQLDVRGQHYHYIPFVNGGDGATVDMEEAPGLTLPRAHPLICVPAARLNPFLSLE
ncbi:cytochrome P450 [Citrus sinensis]|uniref:Cytochrome P450 n=1 Tax=Citrus sinensis TaxID=2711 RepID=A0ACB8LB52_CITSI|nr:cytochrome P450 [Citrus sinensis]